MSRKNSAKPRDISPDSVYGDRLVAKFINSLMVGGNKTGAEKIFYSAMDKIEEMTKEKGIDVFHKAVQNIKPSLEVKSRRIGGATYQVPIEVRTPRMQALAIKWLVNFSRNRGVIRTEEKGRKKSSRTRGERTMVERLAKEVLDASKSTGKSFGKKEEMHKIAEANRAFAHYKW